MQKNTQICKFCGSAFEHDSRFCHNCGAAIEQQTISTDTTPSVRIISESPIYEHTDIDTAQLSSINPTTNLGTNSRGQQYHQTYRYGSTTHYSRQGKKPNETLGILSLVFAILAIIQILPFIGSILAIILGGKKGGPLGVAGRILGIMTLFFGVFVIFLIML